MNFTCTRENLIYSLELVSVLASKQTNLPILNNILLKTTESGVELISTNLEISIKAYLRAKIEKKGEFTIPAKTLLDYIKLLNNEQVEIIKENNEIKIVCGNDSTKIKGIDAEDYPVIPEIEEKNNFIFDVDKIRESISKTVIAVSKNEIRPELSGLFFNFFSDRYNKGLLIAATDSYRLAEIKVDVEQGEKIQLKTIIPGKTALEINRLLQIAKNQSGEKNVRFWISENQVAIRYSNFELTSRIIEGDYPDYTQIIPSSFKTKATFDKDMMINKIKAASLFTVEGINSVSFDLNVSENNIAVSSVSTQKGENSSELDAILEGEENSILLNYRYVLDGIQNIDSEEIIFNVNSADSPCLFKEKNNDNYLYIVMPIRK